MPRWPLLLVLLLVGCAGSPQPPPAALVRDSPWYPLKVGSRWVYRGARQPLTRLVVRHERMAGFDCALIETRLGKSVLQREHVATTADGVYLIAANGQKVAPPLCFLKLPPRAGESWTSGFREGKAARTGLYLLEESAVTVAGKQADAIILKGEILEDGLPKESFTYWFVPGVGMVKQEIRRRGQTRVYELEQFQDGKEP
jgi:hypothetical protein